MRTGKTMISLLLLSAVCVTPAFANYFNNSNANVMLNIGSAPSPTPEMLRRIGDSNYLPRRGAPSAEPVSQAEFRDLMAMEGKPVFGSHGERLGYILGVDQKAELIELQIPSGIAVSMPASLLSDEGRRVIAPTASRADVRTMAKLQTGRTVALRIDMTKRNTRS